MKNNGNTIWNRANELFGRPKNKWLKVDEIIYGWNTYFDNPKEKIEKARFEALKQAIKHHYKNSRFYNQLCKEYNFNPQDLKTPADLEKVPMVPDTFFKEYPSDHPKKVYQWLKKISTVDIGQYNYNGKSLQGFLRWAEQRLQGLVNHSSGTTGNFSFMFRDKITFQRFYYSAIKTLMEAVPPSDDPHYVYPGSPNTYLTLGRWLGEGARVFSKPKRHFLTKHEITMDIARLMSTGQANGIKDKIKLLALRRAMKKGEDKLISLLQDLNKKEEQVYIIGPPFQIYSMLQKMKEKGMQLNLGKSNSALFTGGGWKIFEHKKVSTQEFVSLVEDRLGIPPKNYVDAYGMSEMNGLAISCEGHYKHLHPWIHPFVLDDNQGVLGYDEWGRFAFLDPAAHSYPGFIITGDRVRILEKCPACGKYGPVLDSDISRMKGSEARGCANLMRGMMAEEFKKAEKA